MLTDMLGSGNGEWPIKGCNNHAGTDHLLSTDTTLVSVCVTFPVTVALHM